MTGHQVRECVEARGIGAGVRPRATGPGGDSETVTAMHEWLAESWATERMEQMRSSSFHAKRRGGRCSDRV
jgi:hypothetical protein